MENPIEPHNVEAEEATLGAILIDPSNHYEISGFLYASDFYIHRNGWIWEAFGELVAKQIPIDILTLSNELERKGRLTETGGSAYLVGLMKIPTCRNVEAYARMIKEQSTRRKMIAAASEIARNANDERISVEEALSESLKSIRLVADQPNPDEEIPDALEVAGLWAQTISNEKHFSIPTGVAKLDQWIGGLEPKTQTVLAARPGKGKTAMAWQWARNIAASKHRVLFLSLEMATEPLWGRAVCGLSEVMWKDIRSGKATQIDLEKAIDASNKLAHVYQDYLLIDDKKRTTEKIGRICMKYRPEVLIVDHARYVKDKNPSEVKRLGQITEFFHDLSKELDLASLIICQLSRRSEYSQDNKVPTLEDLRDSGEIEENADQVYMLHWPHPEVYNETGIKKNKIPVDLWIRKFRNAESEIQLHFEYDIFHQWFNDLEFSPKGNGKSRMERMEPREPEYPNDGSEG